MAKRGSSSRPEPKPATISFAEGKRRLTAMREKADALLSARPLCNEDVETWTNQTIQFIQQTFGEVSPHVSTFIGPATIMPYVESETFVYEEDAQLQEELKKKKAALNSILSALETELEFTAPFQQKSENDFWGRLHPAVAQVARSLFDTGHYADAVLAALRELNATIKTYVKKATDKEFDGADLMRKAFSPNNPIVRLADLTTADGKNIQQGYMEIFAGTMTAIRNPKAHSNITIDSERAIHFLHLASLLHYVFDEQF